MDQSHQLGLVELSATEVEAIEGGSMDGGCGSGNSSYCAGKRTGALIGVLCDFLNQNIGAMIADYIVWTT